MKVQCNFRENASVVRYCLSTFEWTIVLKYVTKTCKHRQQNEPTIIARQYQCKMQQSHSNNDLEQATSSSTIDHRPSIRTECQSRSTKPLNQIKSSISATSKWLRCIMYTVYTDTAHTSKRIDWNDHRHERISVWRRTCSTNEENAILEFRCLWRLCAMCIHLFSSDWTAGCIMFNSYFCHTLSTFYRTIFAP